jgi:hypothetical protein
VLFSDCLILASRIAVDIAAWLRGLGLERYEQAFRENEVGLDVLPKLTGEDLKEIGVIPVGDRRRLLEAIAELAHGRDTEPSQTTSGTTPNPQPNRLKPSAVS